MIKNETSQVEKTLIIHEKSEPGILTKQQLQQDQQGQDNAAPPPPVHAAAPVRRPLFRN